MKLNTLMTTAAVVPAALASPAAAFDLSQMLSVPTFVALPEMVSYEMPPCKDTVVETEDGMVCTTDNGVRFRKSGDAWFRIEKLHEKPLGGDKALLPKLADQVGDFGRSIGIDW